MNLHKLLFPGKVKLISEMDKRLVELINQTEELGATTVSTVFLPEDLGFSISEMHDNNGYVDVYSKNKWHISRCATDFHLFHCLGPMRRKLTLRLENLRDAEIILKSVGILENVDNIVAE